MNFRRDINGLRAIAVLAVMFFHFFPQLIQGGFVGVDVFFVISGFLMTGLIFKGLEQGNFSIFNFYIARANRIVPALVVLCLVLFVFGWFFLIPSDYSSLGWRILTSISFVSNIIYRQEAGYFDATLHEKWLLHTWSLSVEWQFYLLYPLILVFLKRFLSLNRVKIVVLLSTFLCFGVGVTLTFDSPNIAYYSLSARVWEMTIGGVAWLYPFNLHENKKRWLEWLGLLCIIIACFFVTPNSAWPGYLALLPGLGAFFIIQAHRDTSLITSNVLFQKLGKWSYSIYLWHWPILVALRYFSLSDVYLYLGVLASIGMGFISYRFIESLKVDRHQIKTRFLPINKLVYLAFFVGFTSLFIFANESAVTSARLSQQQQGMISEMDKDIFNVEYSECGKAVNGILPGCVHGKGPVKAIVVGDSHARSLIPGMAEIAQNNGGSIIDFGIVGCPIIKGAYKINHEGQKDLTCGISTNNVLEKVRTLYPKVPVIIVNRNALYFHGFNETASILNRVPDVFIDKVFNERNDEYKQVIAHNMVDTICEFAQTNPVYLLRPIPELKKHPFKVAFMAEQAHTNNGRVSVSRQEYEERQELSFKMQNNAAKKCGAKIIDPIPYLCDENSCYGDINGELLYFDDDHLSLKGTRLIAPALAEIFQQ